MYDRVFNIGGIEFNVGLTILIVLGTILPMLDAYGHTPVGFVQNALGIDPGYTGLEKKAWDRIFFYLIVPLIVILLFREKPVDYGFGFGNWQEGLLWTAGACLGMAIILWAVARTDSMQAYYSVRAAPQPWRVIYLTGVDLLGWEFIWRGFLLFGMARVLGVGPAIWLQAVPFAFMHLGKPEIETMTTIFGGAAFGFVAWRTNSFVYPFLIHWFIASYTQLIALGKF
ncbi:MAG: CPBP family glutamic-type intramembrane protease [Anaerolineae bacterium]